MNENPRVDPPKGRWWRPRRWGLILVVVGVLLASVGAMELWHLLVGVTLERLISWCVFD